MFADLLANLANTGKTKIKIVTQLVTTLGYHLLLMVFKSAVSHAVPIKFTTFKTTNVKIHAPVHGYTALITMSQPVTNPAQLVNS